MIGVAQEVEELLSFLKNTRRLAVSYSDRIVAIL